MNTDPILFELRGPVALLTLDEALETAGQFQGLAHHTEDHAEAVTAFFQKRAPVFGREFAAGRGS